MAVRNDAGQPEGGNSTEAPQDTQQAGQGTPDAASAADQTEHPDAQQPKTYTAEELDALLAEKKEEWMKEWKAAEDDPVQ